MYTIFRLGMVSDWLRVSEPVTFDWSDSWQHSLMGALVSKLQDTRSPGTSEEHDTVTVDMTPLNINTSTPRHIVHLVMASDWSIVNMWPGYRPLIGQLPGVLSTLSCHCVKSYLMSTIHAFSFWISLLDDDDDDECQIWLSSENLSVVMRSHWDWDRPFYPRLNTSNDQSDLV